MIKHIVMWKLQDGVEGNDKNNYARKLGAMLEALKDKIPQIKHLEVGYDISAGEHSSDVVLYSEFETKEDLAAYQNHPDHQVVIPFIKAVASERRIVDYKC